MIETFDELINARKKYLVSVRENGFENGFNDLLSNMYPDEAHFIYELLQNAEDKKARNVYFKLYDNKLIFEHDGGVYDKSQLFNLNDIDSITNIGKSTKSEDKTSIGKFGVGFKSVFAYTETPKIYSGDFAFEIQNLVLPQNIPNENIPMGITRFVLPFNSKTKSLKETILEIKNGLLNIKDNTLLFLKNIECIKYEIFNEISGEYLRVNESNNLITLITKNKKTKWLRFDKQVKIEDEEDKKIKDCTINIAFKLENDSLNNNLKIVPTNAGVSIFFPAEKETSNLKFIVNAPFASTIARDSVRTCSSNKKLINELAVLMEESLIKIKEYGYMNAEFLKVLPNKTSEITSLYEPIWSAVVKAYSKNAYFPTKDNNLVYLKNVIRGSNDLQSLLSRDDLEILLSRKNIYWLKNPPQLNQGIDNFYKQFNIEEYSSLYDIIFNNENYYNYPINDLIKTKDNDWIYSFFNELTGQNYSKYQISKLCSLNIYKLENNLFSSPSKETIYLVSDLNNELSQSFNILSNITYTYTKKNKRYKNSDIINLLSDLGIHEYNIVDKVEEIINKYNSNTSLSDEEIISDMKIFISYYKTKNSVELFRRKNFVKNTNGGFSRPEELVLTDPYEETFYTKAGFILQDLELNAVSSIYKRDLTLNECIDFTNLLKACNIKYQFEIEEIGNDFYIENLEKFLIADDKDLSLEIYNFFTKEIKDFYDYAFAGNGKVRDDSNIVKNLKECAWLPNKNGDFKKPSEITKKELDSDFLWNDRNHFLSVIGLGKQDEKNEEFDKKLKEKFGKSDREIREAIIAKELMDENDLTIEELKEMKRRKAYLEEKESINTERRTIKNIEEYEKSPEKTYTRKEVFVRENRNFQQAQQYLKNQYYNIDDDTMFCQICHNNMPFKKRDNNWYFETVEIFDNKTLKKEDPSFYLSLCPVCSARYKEYVKTYFKNKENDQLKFIKESIISSINPISIEMDIPGNLKFTQQHINDLKDKLKNENIKESSVITNDVIETNTDVNYDEVEIVNDIEQKEIVNIKNEEALTITKTNKIDDTEADPLGWD